MAAIRVPLITEFKDAGLKQAEKAFDGFARTTKRTLQGVADFGKKVATGLAVVGAGAAAGAFKAIDAAADLAEETSKTGQLFGEAAKEIEDFSRTAARQFGQSRQDALEAANTFAIFGKAAGLAGDDLVGFSTDFVALASDLASFNNTKPEEAVEAIGAALRGEAEPLRRYGILLDDATLKQKALELGIYDGNGALTQQQKIRAAEIAIYEQSSAAQGDFARTSEGLANQQRILRAEFANIVAQIGEKLLPIALELAQFFNDKVLPVIQAVTDAFSERGLAGVFDLAVNAIKQKGPAIRDNIIAFLQSAFDWIRNTGIPAFLELMRKAGEALIDWIGPRIKPMLRKLGEFIAAAAQWFIDEGLPKLVDTLVKLGDALIAWIKPRIGPALEALTELLQQILNWVINEALPKLSAQLLVLAEALVRWIIAITPDVIKALGRLYIEMNKWFITDAIPGLVRLAVGLGRGIITGIGKGLEELFSQLVDFGKEIVRKIVEGIKAVASEIGSTIMNAIPGAKQIAGAAGAVGRTISRILPFAEGGIVTGPTLGLIGEAGPEAVIPLDQMRNMRLGGGGGDINITVTSADPQAVIDAIRTYNRQQGPAPIRIAS